MYDFLAVLQVKVSVLQWFNIFFKSDLLSFFCVLS